LFGTTITMSDTAGYVDAVTFVWNDQTSKWYYTIATQSAPS